MKIIGDRFSTSEINHNEFSNLDVYFPVCLVEKVWLLLQPQVLEKIKCCKGEKTKTNDGVETFFKLKLKLSKNKYFFVHIATL